MTWTWCATSARYIAQEKLTPHPRVTAGATLLAVSGVETSHAVGFALAAQTLLILAGAAAFFAAVAWRTDLHAWSFRPGRAARLAQIRTIA